MKATPKTILEYARDYLAKGWSVVPCHVPVNGGECSCGRDSCKWPGKHPRVSWRQYSERLPTKDEVDSWFGDEFYGSNIGIVTGKVSKLAVVDVDRVPTTFKKMNLPKTLEAITGGIGRHYYYRLETPMPSRIGILPGVDLKADGGFVVAPPSIHKSGRKYLWRWTPGLVELTADMLPSGGTRPNSFGWYDDLLEGVHEGERSITCARLAGRYCNLGLTELETFLLLSGWNEANTPPLSKREVHSTVKAIYDKHSRSNGETTVESVEAVYQIVRKLTGRTV